MQISCYSMMSQFKHLVYILCCTVNKIWVSKICWSLHCFYFHFAQCPNIFGAHRRTKKSFAHSVNSFSLLSDLYDAELPYPHIYVFPQTLNAGKLRCFWILCCDVQQELVSMTPKRPIKKKAIMIQRKWVNAFNSQVFNISYYHIS